MSQSPSRIGKGIKQQQKELIENTMDELLNDDMINNLLKDEIKSQG